MSKRFQAQLGLGAALAVFLGSITGLLLQGGSAGSAAPSPAANVSSHLISGADRTAPKLVAEALPSSHAKKG